MNNQSGDSRYYRSQAALHLKRGLSGVLSPVVQQVQRRLR
jgi:hypothetical protein